MNSWSKSTRNVHGKSWFELVANEHITRMKREEKTQYGIPYGPDETRSDNVILTEDKAKEMLDVLIANGLRLFENQLSIDFFKRNVTVTQRLHIATTPISMDILSRTTQLQSGVIDVVPRIIITDPIPVNKEGQPITENPLPPDYVRAVLIVMNPIKILDVFGMNKTNHYLSLAGFNQEYFKSILIKAAEKWQGIPQITDIEVLRGFIAQGILHEAAHALALHIPDQLPKDMPEIERKKLEDIEYQKWIEIVTDNEAIAFSTVSAKNVIKATQEADEKGMDPVLSTQHHVMNRYCLEMFCDRFSMYLYENYMKIKSYEKIVGNRFGDPMAVEMLWHLEA
ncbi:hypothetical protein GF319_15020, partial [Candidatus Bathyarchaeota archaeon]|nr:hypothetical protein [Candidatus Bathyarchaeota archaeon]